MTQYTRAQLENLWVQAGGSQATASMAAAVALAESGGKSEAINSSNSNGTVDRGLWQINSVHGGQSTTDALANARAAVSISQNGTNWRPWCTAWSNGACGGTFMGPGAPVLKFLQTASGVGSAASPPPSPSGTEQQASLTGVLSGTILDPGAWAQAVMRPLSIWAWYGLMMFFGASIFVFGLLLLVLYLNGADIKGTASSYVGRGKDAIVKAARFKGSGGSSE